MKLSDFDYGLPDKLIAQQAAEPRDSARLMILDKNNDDKHERFSDIIEHLNEDDVLVLNSTKVMKMKLVGKKESGSKAEIILTKCVDAKKNIWLAHIKARNPHQGVKIILKGGFATIIKQNSIDEFVIKLSDKNVLKHSMLPNPPYIKHAVGKEYQTVYAKQSGSLAAPTAGLHFTKNLLKKLEEKGVKIVFVTLHVGFGTFLPVYDIKKYKTEKEYYEISKGAADAINNRKGRLIVVGTTTLKALETSAEYRGKVGKINSGIHSGTGHSDIFIKPGYKFKSGADALITNFHLPKSSLIMLTCAFVGTKRLMRAYEVAVKKKYCFFSLGDAMMVWKN